MKSNFKLLRKIKYILLKNRIHRILPSSGLNFLWHLSGLSKWISEHRDLPYTSFPVKNFDYNQRYGLYKHVVDTEVKDEAIDYLEFGVAKGHSFKWWIENIKHKEASFYGFDTFTGLPEDWGAFKKGDMSNGNHPPEIDDSRHSFYQGIFQKTLNDFLKTYSSNKKKIIHLDADLYSSTLFVLTTISPYLRKGDILLFDEFNVPLHEYKAFTEWAASFYIEYTVIGEVNNYFQVAMKLD
jgi:hypothetical protein